MSWFISNPTSAAKSDTPHVRSRECQASRDIDSLGGC
jgi:hypothetical protein